MNDLFEEIEHILASGTDEFEERVDRQIGFLRKEYEEGILHNPEPTIGMELELYCVDGEGRLARVPKGLLDEVGIAKELGLHNAEVNTEYAVLDEEGLRSQLDELAERMEAAEEAFGRHGLRLVSDGMWVIPPEEGSMRYLSDTEERDGVIVAKNAAPLPRYHTISNVVLRKAGGKIPIEVPEFSGEFETILPEALTTSIQPHHQVPDPGEFPTYFNYSVRLLGPVLALATNSPYLPADLYGEDVDLEAAAYHELRIQIFEQIINTEEEYRDRKVRVPDDLEDVEDVFDQIRADETVVPALAEELDDHPRYEDKFFEFNLQRGTFWRWTRPVIGGETRDEANLRIEFRPLPAQPTLRDTVGLQALFSGALIGLVLSDHPLIEQEWGVAKENFYRAAEDSLEAEQTWVDRAGEETTSGEEMYGELFTLGVTGLRECGVSPGFIEEYVEPLQRRVEAGVTPSIWKRDRALLHAESHSSREALEIAQREYFELQERYLFSGTFCDYWQDI